ncbi:esterase/lipase [Dactylonectria macrodidyma]|uniref:Carboxylic ester hydrolase n=1 Tax=Dactylonectria macrodidyma TaxID=307937 RepID=A0A9P9IRZ4_9HYPO|nr:esterase/lipase [Dactylonectria macrodidyma]
MRPTQATNHAHTLETPFGSLKGIKQEDGGGRPVLYRFLKIPFAQPPVGPLRWRRPKRLPSDFTFNSPSGEPGDYTRFGPISPQPRYEHGLAYLPNPNAAPPIDNVQDEDCLYLNIWVPASSPSPDGGWPVQVYLHGGWLQVGDACQKHEFDPFDLLREGTPRIIVSPTYRLNLFGFLGGKSLASIKEEPAPGNYGFWDQRCALEWIAKYIPAFGGNPNNISVGGLSAGANSAFYQLYYDTHLPKSKRIIKRIYLWSNAVAIQPSRTASEPLTDQFYELCSIFGVSSKEEPQEQLDKLRAVLFRDLINAIPKLQRHTFRATTDNDFIPATFLSSLLSGAFTTRLHDNGVSIMMGEVSDEKELYKLVNPPDSLSTLHIQLENYYPKIVCDALLPLYPVPKPGSADDKPGTYAELYAQIVADGQVHVSHRGFAHLLLNPPKSADVRAMPSENVHRYRISWRAKGLDDWLKPEVGVCHAADMPIWMASGWRQDFSESDKEITKKFLEPFGKFLYGEKVEWGSSGGENRILWLDQDGKIHRDYEDPLWNRGMEVWNAMIAAQKEHLEIV